MQIASGFVNYLQRTMQRKDKVAFYFYMFIVESTFFINGTASNSFPKCN
jgi:hypothetical protein